MPGDRDDEWDDPPGVDPDGQYDGSTDDWHDDEWDDPNTLYESDSTDLDVSALLRAGFEGLGSVTGLVLTGLLIPLSVLATVVRQTLAADYVAAMRETLTDPEMASAFESTPFGSEQVLELLESAGPFPLALDPPAWALALAVVVPPFLAEAVRIVGVRAFAADERNGIPAALARRRLPAATLLGWFGGSVLLMGLYLGLALFVLPGLVLATVMLFYRQEVAVADEGVLGAIRGSWRLTKGNRMALFGLLIVVVLVGFLFSSVFGTVATTVLSPDSPAGPVASAVGQAVGVVFAMSATTEAYVRLREARDAEF
jgi:hypothetical protein